MTTSWAPPNYPAPTCTFERGPGDAEGEGLLFIRIGRDARAYPPHLAEIAGAVWLEVLVAAWTRWHIEQDHAFAEGDVS
jgi:hypothetical protein